MEYFFYGTLMDDDVLGAVIGRRPLPACRATARLRGYRRVFKRWATYPVLIEEPGASVDGVLVHGISRREAVRLDRFEGALYREAEVCVEILAEPPAEPPSNAAGSTAGHTEGGTAGHPVGGTAGGGRGADECRDPLADRGAVGRSVRARVFLPVPGISVTSSRWDLKDWRRRHKARFLNGIAERMGG
jgi:hypothetical protein